jgi:hypothetical protein
LGSPFEQPWTHLNAYNLQDVSRWKDLGPKFVLQVYRDFQYMCSIQSKKSRKVDVQFPKSCIEIPGATTDRSSNPNSPAPNNTDENSNSNPANSSKYHADDAIDDAIHVFESIECSESAEYFLAAVFPAVISAMERTEEYDKDGDGMIENEAYPDQTYDIWTAEGVHAYCGGLWIAANEAAAQMSVVMGVFDRAEHFKLTASRARVAYIDKLWNGSYFNYDSSCSANSDSIMADMLAGHWYARLCSLPGVVPANMALSCYETIFNFNVVKFGEGYGGLIGAVNGMKPDGKVDNSCMQSREVWTGTTYALAAGMLHESLHVTSSTMSMFTAEPVDGANAGAGIGNVASNNGIEEFSGESAVDGTVNMSNASENSETDTHYAGGISGSGSRTFDRSSRLSSESEIGIISRCRLSRKLWQLAFATAQGIHDGGWQRFGYQFATPEAWERNGNYRSLGYMRPLSIWAMQFALNKWICSGDINNSGNNSSAAVEKSAK